MYIIRKLSVILCLLSIINFIGCQKNELSSSAPTESVLSDFTSLVSQPSDVDSEISSYEKTSSIEVVSESSVNESHTISSSSQPISNPNTNSILSTQKIGFSFGVAKNGVPHNISINNQKRFDSMPNVSALALDTVSQEKCMYLTFDCGYEYNNLTWAILDVLKEKNIRAAFFCTLDYLKDQPQTVARMINEGHIVGNHSATHPTFYNISRNQMETELDLVNQYLIDNFNYTSPYFRFPTGAYSEDSITYVTSKGYHSIFWSIAHADWDTENQPSVSNTISTVTNRFHNGAVILLHAVSSSNTQALPTIIDNAINQGYSFKTLDQYPKFLP